jgi:hypothetical protein
MQAVTIKMATIELADCKIQDKVVKATPSLCHGRVHLSTDSGCESDGYARRHAKHQPSSIYQFLDMRFKKRLQLESQLHDNESDEIPQLVSDSDDDSSPL